MAREAPGAGNCNPAARRGIRTQLSATLDATWSEDPNYSHGITWSSRLPSLSFGSGSRTRRLTHRRSLRQHLGRLVLARGVLAVRVVAYERNLQWTESATIRTSDCLLDMDIRRLAAFASALGRRLSSWYLCFPCLTQSTIWSHFPCSESQRLGAVFCSSFRVFGRFKRERH